jgi:shikimate kinase
MDPRTRALIRERAVSVWLRAGLDLLVHRVARRSNRPLLKRGEPREVLEQLMAVRYPVYAEADITVDSGEEPAEQMVAKVIEALREHVGATA